MENCKLCGLKRELKNSHIIPKFAFDWLKKSSATGYLRKAINPNLRVQDGNKEAMLCNECEQKLSKYESYFAKKFFYPYINKKARNFEYDQKLMLFIISLSWRIAVKSLDGFKIFQPNMFDNLKAAEKHWKSLLLKGKVDLKYQHHLFFVDYVKSTTDNIAKKDFNTYMMRSIDATIGANSDQVFTYIKFPQILVTSLIEPLSNSDCIGTQISKSGILVLPQTYVHAGFDGFISSRIDSIAERRISDKQKQKIVNTIIKNPKRALKSKSFETHLEYIKHT